MQIVLHKEVLDDARFREQWNALVEAMERPQAFYTWEWAAAVCRAYSDSFQPLVFAAYREGSLIGVVALGSDPQYKRVSFLTASTADYCDFISSPADRGAFIQAVVTELRRIGIVELRMANLPADSASAEAMQLTARASGYSVFVRPAYLCSQVPLDSDASRQQTRTLAKAKLGRMSKAVAQLGEITVSHSNVGDEFEFEFPEFATAQVARLLATERISTLASQERRTFLTELARLFSQQGWLAFSTAKLGGRSVAWNYGFRFAGTWFWYQPAFDTEQGRISPGAYLLCEILRQAADDPKTHTVDMGLGDEGYKRKHARAGRQTLNLTAYASKRRNAWAVCRHHAAAWVKRSPRLENDIRKYVLRALSVHKKAVEVGIAGCLKFYWSRILSSCSSVTEVSLFEWTPVREVRCEAELTLQPLSLKLLATALMVYQSEAGAQNYLTRSVRRMRRGAAKGFALVSAAGVPVQFCWVADFSGFQVAELRRALTEPAPGAVLLFDCWTPQSQRGHGHYGKCIGLVAARLSGSGKRPWIFSPAADGGSVHEIRRAGFVQRFSLVRRKTLLLDRISRVDTGDDRGLTVNLFPAA